MKRTCCRKSPRCAGCPVLLAAAARRRAAGPAPDLFAEILGGRAARALPESVLRALEELDRRPGVPGGEPAHASADARERILPR